MKENKGLHLLDKVGVCTSALCMLHCLALPVLFIMGLDSALQMVDQEWLEMLIIFLSVVIGLVAFLRGYLLHRQHFIPVLFVTGILLIANGEGVENATMTVLLPVAGAATIIYAHLLNLAYRRKGATS